MQIFKVRLVEPDFPPGFMHCMYGLKHKNLLVSVSIIKSSFCEMIYKPEDFIVIFSLIYVP